MFTPASLRYPFVPASRQGDPAESLRNGRRGARGRSYQLAFETLEARRLLSHAASAPAAVARSTAPGAHVGFAAVRPPAIDPALETLFLKGVERRYAGAAPSADLVAPYLRALERGVPRVRVLQRLLTSREVRDSTVATAYRILLHRSPSPNEQRMMTARLARGGDLRTVLFSLASSREYYVNRAGGTAVGLVNALANDLLRSPTATVDRLARSGRPGAFARASIVRGVVFGKEFNDELLDAAALQILGAADRPPALMAAARRALQRPGGMTRALALLLASKPARDVLAARERQAEADDARPPHGGPIQIGSTSSQALTIPTLFGGALDFNPVAYADTFSGQPAPTVALPSGLVDKPGDEATYEIWFNAESSGALVQAQLAGDGQKFNVPILAVDADGKLTGGFFDVDANGNLAPGIAGAAAGSSAQGGVAVAPTLSSPMTSPLTLNYTVASPNGDGSHSYQVVGPNNAMVSSATVLDRNWHHAALVVDQDSEWLYLDGLLVGAAQADGKYSLGFTDAMGNSYAATGVGLLGGTVDPLPIAAAAQPTGLGYPEGFAGALDEFRVWAVPRTAAEIVQSMDAPLGSAPYPDGLIGYYDFDVDELLPSRTFGGPPVTRLAFSTVPEATGLWAVDQAGALQHAVAAAFQTTPTGKPVSLFASGNLALYVLDDSNHFEIAYDSGSALGWSLPKDAKTGAQLAPTWLGASDKNFSWIISGGKIYFETQLGFTLDYWPEDFQGTATSVAPLGGNASQTYGGYESWGGVPVRALAVDASQQLWISVLSGDPSQPQPYVQARAILAGTHGAPSGQPISQVYAGMDGSVWAIDAEKNVYKMVSVAPDGATYDCVFREIPALQGTTSLAVDNVGNVYAIAGGVTREWSQSSQSVFQNLIPGSPFGPATSNPGATGTSLSAKDVVATPSTIPADPFDGVTRVPGHQAFAPYLAVPYSNSVTTVDLATGSNQVEYKITLAAGDTVVVEVPGAQPFEGPLRVDFLGFTVNPADGSHPVLASYPSLAQAANQQALDDLIQNNMAAAFVAPASGTYLIRIAGPAQGNGSNTNVQLQFSVLPGNSNSLLSLMDPLAVQGGPGTTAASYTDPSAPKGATIGQLLPTADPAVQADRLKAYGALVQAGKDLVSDNESFTDFLNLDSGVTVTVQELLGLPGGVTLEARAYNAVTQDYAKYLGASDPPPDLLAALNDVHAFLGRVDSWRLNVYNFLTVQDSWIQNEINDILGADTLHTIAQTIVDNQAQDNPPPYLEPPPPQTPYSMAADAAIQGGRQALAALQPLLAPLLFAGPAAPFGALLFGLVNIGATVGATFGADLLKQAASRMPKLVVPPDKNQISSLVQAASTYQAQLVAGLTARDDLAQDVEFLYPVFSNVGLLEALQHLNPLVLGSTKAGDKLGPNNPTAAAVTYAAWKNLLPSYFQWAPIDPTTESQSQNFDNLYPGATATAPADAVKQLTAMQSTGLDLQVVAWGNGSGAPNSGVSLVVVGLDDGGLLHIRIFDADGKIAVDADESKLPASQALANLKQQIPGLAPPHVLSRAEKELLIGEATSIASYTVQSTFPYPGYDQTSNIGFKMTGIVVNGIDYAGFHPTSMANSPAGTASGAAPKHLERFYGLVQAGLSQSAAGTADYSNGRTGFTNDLKYSYATSGLYVLGWKLVDANGVEIDPRTAAMIFPTGGAAQPPSGAPQLGAFGGGWYLDAGAPVAPPAGGGGLYDTQADPSDVFLDWFGRSSLLPAKDLTGTLKVGAIVNQRGGSGYIVNVPAPSYTVAYSPITSAPPAMAPGAAKDPGFEQYVVGNGQFQYNIPASEPWSFAGGAGISGNGSGFTSGNPPAPEGLQVAFLQNTGVFSQVVADWAVGTYQVSFKAAQRGNQPSNQDFRVLIDGKAVGTFRPSGKSYANYTTSAFAISNGGPHTIAFQGLDSAGGDNTAFIDDVELEEASG